MNEKKKAAKGPPLLKTIVRFGTIILLLPLSQHTIPKDEQTVP